MPVMPGLTLRKPKSYSPGRPAGPPWWIIFHYTAGAEGMMAAEDGNSYDQRRTDGTSCHAFADGNSLVQEVDTNDRSHSALYNGNMRGIHIELCGTKQTREQWLDGVSRETIRNGAKFAAWAMKVHDIPLTRLVTRQIRGAKGIAGHYDVTYGYPEDKGTHEDPGTAFPWDVLIADILAFMGGTGDTDDMSAAAELQIAEIHKLLMKGERTNEPQTAGGGVKIAYFPRVMDALTASLGVILEEVDDVEELSTQELTQIGNVLTEIRNLPSGGNPEAVATRVAELVSAHMDATQAKVFLDALRRDLQPST